MKDLIKYIITSIVDKPKEFSLEEQTTETGFTNYVVSVSPDDMGKVIGKKGQIIKSIRNIVRTTALKTGKKAIITLKED